MAAGEVYLYTDSSGTAHAVKDFQAVPKRYRSRVSVVHAAEEAAPKKSWSPQDVQGPLIEIVLPAAALIFAWRRYQGFFVRASIAAFVCIWGYFALWSRLSGGDLLKTDAEVQKGASADPAETSDQGEGSVSVELVR